MRDVVEGFDFEDYLQRVDKNLIMLDAYSQIVFLRLRWGEFARLMAALYCVVLTKMYVIVVLLLSTA